MEERGNPSGAKMGGKMLVKLPQKRAAIIRPLPFHCWLMCLPETSVFFVLSYQMALFEEDYSTVRDP